MFAVQAPLRCAMRRSVATAAGGVMNCGSSCALALLASQRLRSSKIRIANRKRVEMFVARRFHLPTRLRTAAPDIAAEWNYDKNPMHTYPEIIGVGYMEPVWWRCGVCGHEYEMSVEKRVVRGGGCAVCAHSAEVAATQEKASGDWLEGETNAALRVKRPAVLNLRTNARAVMFRYFIEDEQQGCPVTLSFGTGQPSAVTMRVGSVRLLRNIEYKGQFFAPFLPTTDLLFLFPSCIDRDGDGRIRPAPTVCDKISRYLTYLHSEAVSCAFVLVDAALCATSGCAMVVLRCRSTMDALQVMSVWGNVEAQDESMRMSALYIQCFPCDEACAAGAGASIAGSMAKLLETNYLLPTCVLCADRLETVMTGQAADTPTCACASSGGHRCSCLQHSCCVICQLFLRAQDTSSTRPPVKCQDCGQSGDPWVCMICGYVGCSRYQAMHAKDHCIRHRHFFSMNLLTQQIWDYHSDAFVHRVVMNVDIHAGNAARVQFPGREQPLVEGMEEDDEAVAGAGVALGKKCVSAKYDAKLSVSHTQYAMLLKNELDAMRALLISGHAQTAGQHAPSRSTACEPPDHGSVEDGTRAQEERSSSNSRVVVASHVDTHALCEPDTDEPSFVPAALRALRAVGRAREQLRGEVAAVGYGLRNLRDELYLSRSQGAQLEQEERALAQELRATVRANAEAELKRQGTIADLEATLQEIELNRRAQRRIAEQLGSGDGVARMAVLGEGRTEQRASAGARRHGRSRKGRN